MQYIRKKVQAFTFIEMLAVLFIIGIIFSITLPTFGPIMGTLKLSTATENIANALESARQYAVTSSQDCLVVFPITGDMAYASYKLYSYNEKTGTGKTVGKVEVLPNNIKISENSYFSGNTTKSVPFPDDNSPNQTVKYVEFELDGSAEKAGNVYVIDQNTRTFQKITYSAIPRKVDIKEVGDDSE